MLHRYRVPGIYIEPEPDRIEPIQIINKTVTGFIGLAEKGPVHKGIRITNFSQFRNIFGGFTDYAYLAYSVYGFFYSGGKECVVVRTAHIDNDNINNSISRAFFTFKDANSEASFILTSQSEGTWGNYIETRLQHIHTDSVPVIKNACKNDLREWIEVESARNFAENDIICIKGRRAKENRRILEIDNNCIYLDAKLENIFQPEEDDIYCENVRFNLTLSYGKGIEEYFYLSINKNDDRYYIKEINSKSKLAAVDEIHSNFLPCEVYYENFTGGRNGISGLTPADYIGYFFGLEDNKGIGIFEAFSEISIIAAPDVLVFEELVHNDSENARKDIFAVQKAMIDQCERLGNRFVILDTPDIKDIIGLMAWAERFDTKDAAVYYPGIRIVNPDDITGLTTVAIPPSGHIAGVYARCDEDDGIYRAPANKFLNGAVGLTGNINNQEYEIIYPAGINILRYVPGRGIKIWGARTLSSDVSWRYINVRRTFFVIRNAIKNGAAWVVFEENNIALRKKIVRHVTAFLLELWRQGYLSGVVPEDGFYVRCDDELNSPEDIDAGIINVEIGVAISRPAEFLIIKIKSDSNDAVVAMDN